VKKDFWFWGAKLGLPEGKQSVHLASVRGRQAKDPHIHGKSDRNHFVPNLTYVRRDKSTVEAKQ
jgi:hypothetical protein